jgi:hypothetical protein
VVWTSLLWLQRESKAEIAPPGGGRIWDAHATGVVECLCWTRLERRSAYCRLLHCAASVHSTESSGQLHRPTQAITAATTQQQHVWCDWLHAGAGGPTLSELLARPVGSIIPHATHALVPATMVGLGHELLEQGESEAAASLARRALAASPRCRPAWLLLAKCFVADRQYAAALVALNVVPTPPLPAAEVELLHVVPPPAPKATTKPQVCGAGNPAVCLRKLAKVSCILSTCAASVASNSLYDVQGRLQPALQMSKSLCWV